MLPFCDVADVFDEAEALSLLDGDRELLRSLTRLCLDLSPLILGDITVALARAHADKVVRLAQRLDASACQICAPRVAASARALALEARTRGLAETAPLVTRLSSDLSQLHRR